jgi:hypothetical protein
MKSLISSVFIIALMGLSLGISSCSDDSTTTPTADGDIMPLKTGSYYVYTNTRLDSLTGNPDLGAVIIDSMVVGSPTTIEGVSAYGFDIYRLGQKVRTDYYAKNGQTISGYWQFIPPGVTLTELINTIIPQTRRWSKFADFAATTEWTIADTSLTGVTVPLGGQDIPATATIKMTGKKLTTTTETISGMSYPNTTKFELTLTITPSLNVLGTVVPVAPISVKQYVWVAENVGIVKEDFPNVDLAISVLGSIINYKGDGIRKELIRYSIK